MKREKTTVTENNIIRSYRKRRKEIKKRLSEFEEVWSKGDNLRLWEEMVFCFFTGGCSAKMGLKSIEAVRPLLMTGDQEELSRALVGSHRFPNARARYIVASREFLVGHCGMRIRDELEKRSHLERRDWLVKEKRIKGLAYKEASHFLRNVGLKGYAILDKHVLNCLFELKIIDDPKPPKTRRMYLTVEEKLETFADRLKIDFDEMDLVLWSMKTGEILK
ncbi:MAG: N-glycosylase/DNA lyase [Pyrinomonadaceae bacterium]|nr:N-glycosylase/DNA lyase [Pyrinomonadaceae bacterium]